MDPLLPEIVCSGLLDHSSWTNAPNPLMDGDALCFRISYKGLVQCLMCRSGNLGGHRRHCTSSCCIWSLVYIGLALCMEALPSFGIWEHEPGIVFAQKGAHSPVLPHKIASAKPFRVFNNKTYMYYSIYIQKKMLAKYTAYKHDFLKKTLHW